MTEGTPPGAPPRLAQWVALAREALFGSAALLRPVFEDQERLQDPVARFLGLLNVEVSLTSDSVLLLVESKRAWDAETLVRTVSEASLRVAFICSHMGNAREQVVHEFAETLTDIASLRRHEHATHLLSTLVDPHSQEWQAIRDVILPPEEVKILATRYPQKLQREVSSRWSFAAMARHLDNTPRTVFKGFGGLAYRYGMSSHLTHLDADGIGMMAERRTRSPERIAAIELAHAGRLLSDVVSFAALRVQSIRDAYHIKGNDFNEWLKATAPLLDSIHLAHEEWHAVEYGSTSSSDPPSLS